MQAESSQKAVRSAGVLIYRRVNRAPEVLLVHPGGPFWRKRDRGAWQIPKGEIGAGESIEAAALREAEEELGVRLEGALVPLGQLRQAGGKIVACFALEQDIDATAVGSNLFELEWPPKSGKRQSFPEIDAARWFAIAQPPCASARSAALSVCRQWRRVYRSAGRPVGLPSWCPDRLQSTRETDG